MLKSKTHVKYPINPYIGIEFYGFNSKSKLRLQQTQVHGPYIRERPGLVDELWGNPRENAWNVIMIVIMIVSIFYELQCWLFNNMFSLTFVPHMMTSTWTNKPRNAKMDWLIEWPIICIFNGSEPP